MAEASAQRGSPLATGGAATAENGRRGLPLTSWSTLDTTYCRGRKWVQQTSGRRNTWAQHRRRATSSSSAQESAQFSADITSPPPHLRLVCHRRRHGGQPLRLHSGGGGVSRGERLLPAAA